MARLRAKSNPVAAEEQTPPASCAFPENAKNPPAILPESKIHSHPPLRARIENAILQHSDFDGPKRMVIEDCDGQEYIFIVPEAGEC